GHTARQRKQPGGSVPQATPIRRPLPAAPNSPSPAKANPYRVSGFANSGPLKATTCHPSPLASRFYSVSQPISSLATAVLSQKNTLTLYFSSPSSHKLVEWAAFVIR